MVKFQTRLMVAVFVARRRRRPPTSPGSWPTSSASTRPRRGLLPVTKGVPELSRYLLLLPLIALLWPAVLYFHGLYQVKRGRSRIDELFAIVFSVLIASALTLGATLYVRVYYRFQPEVAPLWEYSQAVFGLFVVLDVARS